MVRGLDQQARRDLLLTFPKKVRPGRDSAEEVEGLGRGGRGEEQLSFGGGGPKAAINANAIEV